MEVMACEVDVNESAWVISCLSFACRWMFGRALEEWVYVRTSKASIMSDATSLEGAPKLCCADMRLIRSEMCCSVGARVIEARCNGNRLPGGPMHAL